MKPKFLYHGSKNRDIKIFEPRMITVRDKTEGPVIFATTTKAKASIFIVPTVDPWTQSGAFNNVNFFICNDRHRFVNMDKGGAIYTIFSDSFNNTGGGSEWVSKVPVKVHKMEEYKSGLNAMLSLGVQVYFVDDEMFSNIIKSSDHGYSILKSTVSVNQKDGINIKNL